MKTWFITAVSVALLTFAMARPEGKLQAKEFLDQVQQYLKIQEDNTYAQTPNELTQADEKFATQQQAIKQESRFRHIYSLDMTIPDQKCPDALKLNTSDSLRLCGKKTGKSCDSLIIQTGGKTYQEVRGKITAYQFGSPDAFRCDKGIDSVYVDGISITHGKPRKHIWTYAVGFRQYLPGYESYAICPSSGGNVDPPEFVGDHYFCSSGNPGPKWSAELYPTPLPSNILGNCTDCGDNDLFFCAKLATPTTDDLEVRVCADEDNVNNEDIRIESMDFYIR